MKNKGLTYILLIVVGFIWYKVFFRIKENLMGEDIPVISQEQTSTVRVNKEREAFQLKANYRDPFHSKPKKIINLAPPTNPITSVYTPPVTVKKTPPPPKIHQWPKIRYYGTVKNHQAKKPLCIINIDDMLFNLREGDVVLDGIQIKKVYRDSILVQQGKHRKVFHK